MTKKKKVKGNVTAEATQNEDATARNGEFLEPAPDASAAKSPALAAGAKKKTLKKQPAIAPSPQPLYICRNKHWRHISAFHGPWLQMPTDILEIVANIIYHTPRPRPIDPAILFDLIKIHRLVDEATNLAVRAASDMATPTLTSVNGNSNSDYYPMNTLGLGGSPHGTRLSRERKFRIREQACQKLARAYRLNEILCSVATMQGATALEQIGDMVLQRHPKDPDAQYVHFFHEKIPSRQVAQYTSLEPLDDILNNHSGEASALRTRATVKVFKHDFAGAVQDLTHALSICRLHMPSGVLTQQTMTPSGTEQYRKRYTIDRTLQDKDHPGSLESQLLFQRASIYLTEACNHVADSFPPVGQQNGHGQVADKSSHLAGGTGGDEGDDVDHESNGTASKEHCDSRKAVKLFARRALKDYMAFLSLFDYSPDLPTTFVKDTHERISSAVRASRSGRYTDTVKPMSLVEAYTVYPMSDLFAAVTPSGLPAFPPNELIKKGAPPLAPALTCEWATFHPLLTDALHSLLLCHCLAQTSAKELQRHTYMVARLVRLSDGYPIFQGSRSPARSDWNEILNRSGNWLDLATNWDALCTPDPNLPSADGSSPSQPSHETSVAASAAAALINGRSSPAEKAREEMETAMAKERAREQAIIEALEDERVNDIQSFEAAIRSRHQRDEARAKSLQANEAAKEPPTVATSPLPSRPASRVGLTATSPQSQSQSQAFQPARPTQTSQTSPKVESWQHRWNGEDGRDYPIMTERAAAISVWLRDAPLVTGTARRKKRSKKINPAASVGVDHGVAEAKSLQEGSLEPSADVA